MLQFRSLLKDCPSLSPAHWSALQGALGAWKLFLEDRTMKSRNGVAVPAATPGPQLQTHCMIGHVGDMWDPQQELLQPTPHFSPSKNSLAGCWLRRYPCAPASFDLTSKINHNVLTTPHRKVLREVWDSFPNSTPTALTAQALGLQQFCRVVPTKELNLNSYSFLRVMPSTSGHSNA